MARIRLEHLTKDFAGNRDERIRAVSDLNLTVEANELLVLVGPSGSGKTTLLRLIAGLEEPSSGTVYIDGRDMSEVPAKERDVAMVFQNPALYPHLSVFENMAFGLKLRGMRKEEISRRVKETAEILELSECLERKPEGLSGGQRQRVALGRALVRRPSVFLLDEPLSNLDASTRIQLRSEICRVHAETCSTMIYVTHDQREAGALGNRVGVLNQGMLQQIGTPLEVYRAPANRFVAGFIGSPAMNFFFGTLAREGREVVFRTSTECAVSGKAFKLRLNETQAERILEQDGRQVVLGLRPEDVVRCDSGKAAGRDQAIEAVLERVEATGPETYLHLRFGSQRFVAREPGAEDAKSGESMAMCFLLERAHIFDAQTGDRISQPFSSKHLNQCAS